MMILCPAWIWQPMISPLHIMAISAVLGALAVFMYARGFSVRPLGSIGLLLMRLAVIAALAVVLMGPSEVPPAAKQPNRSVVHILVDTSRSMLTEDAGGVSRIAAAQSSWLGKELAADLGKHFRVKYSRFDENLRPTSLEMLHMAPKELAAGRTTRLSDSLARALQMTTTSDSDVAFVVISDGHDSAGESLQAAALLAKARGIRVNTVCLGAATVQPDLALVAMPGEGHILAGQEGSLMVRLHQVGMGPVLQELQKAGKGIVLRMRCGENETTHPVDFAGKDSVLLHLPISQDKSGLYEYHVSVAPLAGEIEHANNSQSVFVEVTSQRIAILLLEGEPFWDTKFIAQSLRQDSRIELTQITRLASGRTETIVTRSDREKVVVPTTAEQFAMYDVIVLGRGMEYMLTGKSARLLAQYVSESGGYVVFARGQAYDPQTPAGREMGRELAVIEPVVWSGGTSHNLSLSVTAVGRSTFLRMDETEGIDSASLPGFTVMPSVAREKTATQILARAMPAKRAISQAPGQYPPAIVCMNYGRGRVVGILGEGLWRWSLLPAKGQRDLSSIYHELWSRLVGWLVMGGDFIPSHNVSLSLGSTCVRLGDPVIVDSACKLAPADGYLPKAHLIDPSGKSTEIPLGSQPGSISRVQGQLITKLIGTHTVILESPGFNPQRLEKKFTVYDVDIERLQVAADPQAMRELAETSGGRTFAPDQANLLAGELHRIQAMHSIPRRPHYIWDQAIFLVMLLAWAGLEWLMRRKAGLL